MKVKVRKAKSADKPSKPYADFPLTPHPSGRWCKKIRGKLFYYGKWRGVPEDGWRTALDNYEKYRDADHSGRARREDLGDGLTVKQLGDRFCTIKEQQRDNGEITARHFDDLFRDYQLAVDEFGRTRLVGDLASDDFELLRAKLAKRRGAWALAGAIQRIRSFFKYAYEADLIDRPVCYGPNFKKPAKAILRRERAAKGERLFEAPQIRRIIKASGVPLTAMIYLGINCGLGNSDCGQLRISHLDLKGGWLNYPRPKTGIHRRCKLWPETVTALRKAIAERPAPDDEAHAELVFITKYGQPWAKDKMANPISHEFRKLLVEQEMYREGLSFYTLRHQFETVAGGSRDQVAVNHIMGHADASMAAVNGEQIDDSRLEAVGQHVKSWLYPAKSKVTKTHSAKSNE
jgi:integrase